MFTDPFGLKVDTTSAVISGELHLPHTDPLARVYKPGWIGNVLIGGIAALVFWGLYGPVASAVMIGPTTTGAVAILRVSDLFGALLTGVGGGKLLTAELDKRILEKEKRALTEARDTLADAVQNLVP